MARCCGAGGLQNQPRGIVVVFLGGNSMSCRPHVRVIAPGKEVMIGGMRASFRGRGCALFVEARRGWAKAGGCIALSGSAPPDVRWERVGGLAMARRRTAAISEPPSTRRRNSSADTLTCQDRMVLKGPREGRKISRADEVSCARPSVLDPTQLVCCLAWTRISAAALSPTPLFQQLSKHLRN